MFWLQRHASAALYATFALAVTVMICCIVIFYYYAIIDLNLLEDYNMHPQYIKEYSLMFGVFFGTANAMVIFRLFSLSWITILSHALIHMIIFACLIAYLVLFQVVNPVHSFYQSYSTQVYLISILYLLQCLVALDLIIFRPGKTMLEREIRSGIHAFLGVIIFVVMFWNMMLVISMLCVNSKHNRHNKMSDEALNYSDLLFQPSVLIVLVAIYMLLILFILLTPFFRFDIQECLSEDKLETMDNESEDFCIEYCIPAQCLEDEKGKLLMRQDMAGCNARKALGGRHQSARQDFNMNQMSGKLNEVWQAERVSSQLSIAGNVCHELTPQISKIPSIGRVGKLRKLRSESLECRTASEIAEPEYDFLTVCQNPQRSRCFLDPRTSVMQQQKLKKSCSQTTLASHTFNCGGTKSSSVPRISFKYDDDNRFRTSSEHFPLPGFDENSLFCCAQECDNGRENQSQLALTMHRRNDPVERHTCTKSASFDNNDLPCGIASNASHMHIGIPQTECPKIEEKNSAKAHSKTPIVVKATPHAKRKRVEECDKSQKYQRDKKHLSPGKPICSAQSPRDECKGAGGSNKISKQQHNKSLPSPKFPTKVQSMKEQPKKTVNGSKTSRNQNLKKSASCSKCSSFSIEAASEEDCKPSFKEKNIKKCASCEQYPVDETEVEIEKGSYKMTKGQRVKLSESFQNLDFVAQLDAKTQKKEHVKKCASCGQHGTKNRRGVDSYMNILDDYRAKQCKSCGKTCSQTLSDSEESEDAEDFRSCSRAQHVRECTSCAKCSSPQMDEDDCIEEDCIEISMKPDDGGCRRQEVFFPRSAYRTTNERVKECDSCGKCATAQVAIEKERGGRHFRSPLRDLRKKPKCRSWDKSTNALSDAEKDDSEEDCRTFSRRTKRSASCEKCLPFVASKKADCEDEDKQFPSSKIMKKYLSCGNFSINSISEPAMETGIEKYESCEKTKNSSKEDEKRKEFGSFGRYLSAAEEDELVRVSPKQKCSQKCGPSRYISPVKQCYMDEGLTKSPRKCQSEKSHIQPDRALLDAAPCQATIGAPIENIASQNARSDKNMSNQSKVKQSRYFSGRFGAYSPHKMSADCDTNTQSLTQKKSNVPRFSSTQSQTEFPEKRISFASQTDQQDKRMSIGSQTDLQDNRMSFASQTDQQDKKMSFASQTDQQDKRISFASQADQQDKRISFTSQTDQKLQDLSLTPKVSISSFYDSDDEASVAEDEKSTPHQIAKYYGVGADMSQPKRRRKNSGTPSQSDGDQERIEDAPYKTSKSRSSVGSATKTFIITPQNTSAQSPQTREVSSQTNVTQIDYVKQSLERDQSMTVPSLHGLHKVRRSTLRNSTNDTRPSIDSKSATRGSIATKSSIESFKSLEDVSKNHPTASQDTNNENSQKGTFQKIVSSNNSEGETSSGQENPKSYLDEILKMPNRNVLGEIIRAKPSEQSLGSSSGKSSDINLHEQKDQKPSS